MLWSGSSSRTAVRDSMWGLLLFAGVAWLAMAWSVLRLAPSDVVTVGGAVLFFGALCEVVRTLVGMKTWWLNLGMAVLFAATGGVLLADRDSLYSTPLSLIAWFLMVRGALDVAVSVMNRGVDRTWGLVMTLGLAQAGLGFFAASPLAQATDPVIVTLGGLCMLRAVADLTTSLRLREVAHAHHDVLALPPERQAGVAGYAAGLADYPAHPDIHQPETAGADVTIGSAGKTGPAEKVGPSDSGLGPRIGPSGSGPTAGIGLGGNSGAGGNSGLGGMSGPDENGESAGSIGLGGNRGSGVRIGAGGNSGPAGSTGLGGDRGPGANSGPGANNGPGGNVGLAGKTGVAENIGAAEGIGSAGNIGSARNNGPATARHRASVATSESFHAEVVRTTADLDSMIANAGVAGTGAAQHRIPENLPPVPDTPAEVATPEVPRY